MSALRYRTISASLLRHFDACDEQVELFEQTFGAGEIAVSRDVIATAARVGLDLDWAAQKLLVTSASDAYRAAIAPALQAYKTATAQAWQVYEAATAPALQAYKAAIAQALLQILETHGDIYPAACPEVMP